MTTTPVISASGTSEVLMLARYGLLSTSPSTLPYSPPTTSPPISGTAWRERPTSRMPQYGITGRMSLAPSMRTSSVRPRARPPSAAITRRRPCLR